MVSGGVVGDGDPILTFPKKRNLESTAVESNLWVQFFYIQAYLLELIFGLENIQRHLDFWMIWGYTVPHEAVGSPKSVIHVYSEGRSLGMWCLYSR